MTDQKNVALFAQPTPDSIARNLRQLRKAKGWTLSDVQRLSRRTITAVALGSYERGDRALSIKRAIDLATLYGIPLSALISTGKPALGGDAFNFVLDLRHLAKNGLNKDLRRTALLSIVRSIAQERHDWNGEVMSLRKSDLSTLALMVGESAGDVQIWLQEERFILLPTV